MKKRKTDFGTFTTSDNPALPKAKLPKKVVRLYARKLQEFGVPDILLSDVELVIGVLVLEFHAQKLAAGTIDTPSYVKVLSRPGRLDLTNALREGDKVALTIALDDILKDGADEIAPRWRRLVGGIARN